jgi:hypothetical protein
MENEAGTGEKRQAMIVRESLHDKVVRHLALEIVAGDLTTLPNVEQGPIGVQPSRSAFSRGSVESLPQ